MEKEIADLKKKAAEKPHVEEKRKDQMTIQMGGELQTVDIPGMGVDEDVQLVLLKAEPKATSAASSKVEDVTTEEEKKKSKDEVELAKKQMEFENSNENRIKVAKQQLNAMRAKRKAAHAQAEKDKKQLMPDGLIHREDGTKIEPGTGKIIDGVNLMAQK